jgi:hypothetical protein
MNGVEREFALATGFVFSTKIKIATPLPRVRTNIDRIAIARVSH